LRRGDVLFVHHPLGSREPAIRGTVEYVTVRGRRDNEVGIRLDDADHEVVWPSWLGVHAGATGIDGTCWRCDHAAGAEAS
jgi:hypothetical protein